VWSHGDDDRARADTDDDESAGVGNARQVMCVV
jgi:hypothetical protein